MAESHRLVVGPEHANARIDIFLAASDLVSRRRARMLLDEGAVYLNRQRIRVASRQVRVGDTVEIYLTQPTTSSILPELPILYRDEHLVVVNKPAGMPVQPTRESAKGTVLEALKPLLLPHILPRVVHRLDRETSGVLVLALTREAAAGLSEQLAQHQTGRLYLACCERTVEVAATLRHYLTPVQLPPAGVQGPARVYARPLEGRPRPEEKEAVLHCARLATSRDFSLLCVQLETGRTHQIRAQLAAVGLPLAGDTRYGAAPLPVTSPLQRLALHAMQLEFVHPTTQEKKHFTAPVPPDLRDFITRLELPVPESLTPPQPAPL